MSLAEQVERIAANPLAEFKHWQVLVYLRYAPRVAAEDFQARTERDYVAKHFVGQFPWERLN
jgi:hypothetical protein